jgi:fatty-acid desaturase
MSAWRRWGNVLGVFVPIAGFVAAIALLWNRFVGRLELGVMTVLYVLTGLGITVGFHRLLTHKAFDTFPAIKAAFAVLGSMAVQGPVTRRSASSTAGSSSGSGSAWSSRSASATRSADRCAPRS